MRKIDNKGFTVIELILSFTLVMILSVGMYKMVANYRDKSQLEAIRSEMIDYKTKIIADIENDISEKFLDTVDYCRKSGTIEKRCLVLKFKDGTSKRLMVRQETKTDVYYGAGDEKAEYSYQSPYITYGAFNTSNGNDIVGDPPLRYTPPQAKFLTFISDYMLEFTTTDDDLENGMALYKIYIGIKHSDLEETFDINIVALGNNNIFYGKTGKYQSFSIGQKVQIKLNDTQNIYDFYVIKDSSEFNDKLLLLHVGNLKNSTFNPSTASNIFENSAIKNELANATTAWKTPTDIRLITAEEVSFLAEGCPKYKNAGQTTLDLTPYAADISWLYSTTYWTMSPYTDTTNNTAWYIQNNGSMKSSVITSSYGIRPVIEVSKNYVMRVY